MVITKEESKELKVLKERTKSEVISLLKSRRLTNSEIDILTQMVEDMATERTHYDVRKMEFVKRDYIISGIRNKRNLNPCSTVITDSREDT